jgi:hypothetical protein
LNSNHNSINDPNQTTISKKEGAGKIRILYYIIFVTELIMAGQMLLFWDTMNAFGVFYAGALSLILKSLFVLFLFTLGYFRFCRLFKVSSKYVNPNVPWAVKIPILAIFVIGIFLYNLGVMTLVKGLCVANHNSDVPGIVMGEYGISTALTRHWTGSTCPNKPEPCHVYSTLPEEALNYTFINFHMNPESCPNGNCNPSCLVRKSLSPVPNFYNRSASSTPHLKSQISQNGQSMNQ